MEDMVVNGKESSSMLSKSPPPIRVIITPSEGSPSSTTTTIFLPLSSDGDNNGNHGGSKDTANSITLWSVMSPQQQQQQQHHHPIDEASFSNNNNNIVTPEIQLEESFHNSQLQPSLLSSSEATRTAGERRAGLMSADKIFVTGRKETREGFQPLPHTQPFYNNYNKNTRNHFYHLPPAQPLAVNRADFPHSTLGPSSMPFQQQQWQQQQHEMITGGATWTHDASLRGAVAAAAPPTNNGIVPWAAALVEASRQAKMRLVQQQQRQIPPAQLLSMANNNSCNPPSRDMLTSPARESAHQQGSNSFSNHDDGMHQSAAAAVATWGREVGNEMSPWSVQDSVGGGGAGRDVRNLRGSGGYGPYGNGNEIRNNMRRLPRPDYSKSGRPSTSGGIKEYYDEREATLRNTRAIRMALAAAIAGDRPENTRNYYQPNDDNSNNNNGKRPVSDQIRDQVLLPPLTKQKRKGRAGARTRNRLQEQQQQLQQHLQSQPPPQNILNNIARFRMINDGGEILQYRIPSACNIIYHPYNQFDHHQQQLVPPMISTTTRRNPVESSTSHTLYSPHHPRQHDSNNNAPPPPPVVAAAAQAAVMGQKARMQTPMMTAVAAPPHQTSGPIFPYGHHQVPNYYYRHLANNQHVTTTMMPGKIPVLHQPQEHQLPRPYQNENNKQTNRSSSNGRKNVPETVPALQQQYDNNNRDEQQEDLSDVQIISESHKSSNAVADGAAASSKRTLYIPLINLGGSLEEEIEGQESGQTDPQRLAYLRAAGISSLVPLKGKNELVGIPVISLQDYNATRHAWSQLLQISSKPAPIISPTANNNTGDAIIQGKQ